MGITPSQLNEMQRRVADNRTKGIASMSAEVAQTPLTTILPLTISHRHESFITLRFKYVGAPMGKPRMTRSDKWKKRPKVMRYRAFADGIRAACGDVPSNPDGVIVTAHCPMPPSWSKKKQAEHDGRPMRQTPDWDNIGKAVCDALFEEDSMIWFGVTIKFWCPVGQERLEVELLYAKS